MCRAQDAVDDSAMAGLDTGFATAEPPPKKLPYETTQPATRPVQPPANVYETWSQWKADLADKTGTHFDLCVISTDQFMVDGPARGNNRGIFWYNFNLTQNLWTGAKLITNTRGGKGLGLDRYADDQLSVNHYENEATSVYVSHLYLEQKLWEDRVTLAVGKLDLQDYFDTNEVGSWNYLSYSFDRNPAIPAPWHAIGGLGRWDITDQIYVQAGAADNAGCVTQSGLNTAFDTGEPYFSMYELGLKPHIAGRPGNYRFIFWYDSTSRTEFGGGTRSGDYGEAVSFDQQISDHLGVYTRYGHADHQVRKIGDFWSAGVTWAGLISSRDKDVLGAGVGQAFLSRGYRQTIGASAAESQVEAYYKLQLTPFMAITPDLQVIVNPDTAPGNNAALVAGVNMELDF